MNNGLELTQNSGIITNSSGDEIWVSRQDLLSEHQALLSRLQHVRKLLGLEPLPTRKQQQLHRR